MFEYSGSTGAQLPKIIEMTETAECLDSPQNCFYNIRASIFSPPTQCIWQIFCQAGAMKDMHILSRMSLAVDFSICLPSLDRFVYSWTMDIFFAVIEVSWRLLMFTIFFEVNCATGAEYLTVKRSFNNERTHWIPFPVDLLSVLKINYPLYIWIVKHCLFLTIYYLNNLENILL